ncbi:MAG TPA: hypothetical protein VN226_02280 [Anaerolineales bacterium]|nr:hypothetical protein [Anaerolineales bacterium]
MNEKFDGRRDVSLVCAGYFSSLVRQSPNATVLFLLMDELR